MCGIFACVTSNKDVALKKLNKLKTFLSRRGPDCQNLETCEVNTENGTVYLVFYSTVLHIRGASLVEQPLVKNDNFLLWNGEIFGGFEDLDDAESDTSFLCEKLSVCETDSDIANCIAEIVGPYAIVFYHHLRKRLWFARDYFGRRSLCLKGTGADSFILCSVAPFMAEGDPFKELPCDGIYFYDLNDFPQSEPQLLKWSESTSLHSKIMPSSKYSFKRITESEYHDYDYVTLSDPVTDQFLKVLHRAVSKRVLFQNFMCRECIKLQCLSCSHCTVAVLFSGGLDSAVVALICDSYAPPDSPIDLINVSFNANSADRATGIKGYGELKQLRPNRCWNFVKVDVSLEELKYQRNTHIKHLIYPLQTVLDDSIGCALWFAAQGVGILDGKPYTSPARVVLLGMGADEQLAGYSKHRKAFLLGGVSALEEEIFKEIKGISSRNLGRDDRIVSDSGREARFPYLDEDLVKFLSSLPSCKKCDLNQERGIGEKLLLRLVAEKLGLKSVSKFYKRAIQFGSGIAKLEDRKEKASNKCLRLQ